MKPSFKLAFLAFSVLAASPAVLAQNYQGSVSDLNTIFDPPMNINGTLCDVNVNTGNEHAYKACSDGVSAARWMAEKYAKNTGKYLGCLDGYYQGIQEGFSAGSNPTPEMIKQAAAYVAGATFKSAETRGLSKAAAEGRTESADQIIARYRAVINLRDNAGRQVLPNKEYSYPTVSFDGFKDGYETDILSQASSDFNDVYATGWVTASSSFEDRMAARRALQLQKEFAANLCNQNDTIFGRRNMPVVSIWDFFRQNRRADFQNNGWRNPDWAWEIFDRDERTLEQYQTFSRLKTLEKTVSESVNITERVIKLDAAGLPVRKLDAAGLPAVDASGKPIYEYEDKIIGSRIETRRVKLSDAEVQALANLYINGFKQAYDRFYARQYASINYHVEGLDKYKVAKVIGAAIGQEVANHGARKDAYNTQYQLQSAKKYAAEVKRLYKDSFDHLVNIFENNSVVELNEAEVVGNMNDAIFTPGEELKIQLIATNLGEKSAPTTIAFDSTADLNASQKGFQFTAPAFTRANYVTTVLGTVNSDKEARTSINVGMAIRNPGDLAEVAKSLVIRKNKTINLNAYTEIDGVSASLDYLTGNMSVVANIKNPASNVESPIAVVETSVGNLGFIEKNVAPIAPGQTTQVVMNLATMDPLQLIMAGTISGNVNVRLAGKIVHRAGVSVSIPVAQDRALVVYLDALATNRTMNSGTQNEGDRQAKLIGMLEVEVTKDIERNILWKKETASSIVGTIQSVYNETKRAGRINAETQAVYDTLGRALAMHVKDSNFRAGGGIRLSAKGNKETYLKEIGKFAKISTKLKEYER